MSNLMPFLRKNSKKSFCYTLWLGRHRLINSIVSMPVNDVRKPGCLFQEITTDPVFVAQRRTRATAAVPGVVLRRMRSTTWECHGPTRGPRRRARGPCTDGATTARRGAVRGPVCPPLPGDRRVAAGAWIIRSATIHRDSRNSARRWRRSVPAPPTRRVFPTHPTENSAQLRRPNPGQSEQLREEPARLFPVG